MSQNWSSSPPQRHGEAVVYQSSHFTAPSISYHSPTKGLEDQIHAEHIAEEEEMGSQSMSHRLRGVLYHLFLAISVLLPLIIASLLTEWLYRERYFGGSFYLYVQENRSLVQGVVNVVTTFLAYLDTFVVSDFLAAAGIRLSENPVFRLLYDNIGLTGARPEGKKETLHKTKTNAKQYMHGIHRLKTLLLGIGGFIFLLAPHFVWTAALTPNVVSQADLPLRIPFAPRYGQETSFNWANNTKKSANECFGSSGFGQSDQFQACPATEITDSLFQSLLQSPSDSRYGSTFSSYYYRGRSYGVGAAVGLLSLSPFAGSLTPLLTYNDNLTYYERGYNTSVTCQYNASSAWTLQQITTGVDKSSNGIPIVFEANGRFPNSDWTSNRLEPPAAVVGQDADHTVAWGVKSARGQNIIAIATATDTSVYNFLNGIQCSATFEPTWFYVNVSGLEIDVTPAARPVNAVDPGEFHPGLAETALAQLGILSTLQAPSSLSDLGQGLYSGYVAQGGDPRGTETALLMSTVADSIAAALDSLLLYTAGSQLFVNNRESQQIVEVTPTVFKIQIGRAPYVPIIFTYALVLAVASVVRQLFTLYTGHKTFKEGWSRAGKGTDEQRGEKYSLISQMQANGKRKWHGIGATGKVHSAWFHRAGR